METKKIKIVLTKVGTAYEPTKEYHLHDYIVIDDVTLYTCKRVDKTTMTCVGHPLTDTDYWDKSIDMSDALAKATKATEDATTAAQEANAATSKATQATTDATTAAHEANTATEKANTATAKVDAATANVTDAITKATEAANSVKSLLDAFASTNPYVGFARVSGDTDPTPATDFVYGSRALVREIGSHIKLGTVKRVGNNAVLQHECAKGRITLASNGDEVAVDGTEGDLLVYTDIPLYLLKANEVVNSKEMSCMGVGVVPCYWQNHAAK